VLAVEVVDQQDLHRTESPYVQRIAQTIAALAGWLFGFAPGSRGNGRTALIVPGRDWSPDPEPL
jgi:hypothetical protein